jgi:hypothetical protein
MTKKLYNQPEVLVAHIATMSVICASGDVPTPSGDAFEIGGGSDPTDAF